MATATTTETLVRPRAEATCARRRALFEEALSVIERRYDDERLDLDALAREIFTSRRQLQRSFAEAGTSVRERLHAVRMERAAELLRSSSLPVSEVARSVGYREPVQFAKAFRRYHELAPAKWRASAARQPAIGGVAASACRCGCQSSTRRERSVVGPRRTPAAASTSSRRRRASASRA